MADYTQTQTGDWDDAATWGGGGFPVDGDNATTANTFTVTCTGNERCDDFNGVAGSTIAIGSNQLRIDEDLTFGTTVDITGDGEFFVRGDTGSHTYTNNKTGTFSLTGNVNCRLFAQNIFLISGDWSNADMLCQSTSSADRAYVPQSGTLKCVDFKITNSDTGQVTISNDTNNMSYEMSGNVELHEVDGVYTVVWTKGTGSITLTGGAANIALDNQTYEDLIVNASDTKTITEDAGTTDSLTITAGTLNLGVYDITSTGLVDVSGTLQIGSSASSGLISSGGVTFNSGSTANLQTDSIIKNGGNYTCHNSAIFTSRRIGSYTQTASANMSTPNFNNEFYNFTVDPGVVLTLTDDALTGSNFGGSCTINGTVAVGSNTLRIGAGSGGAITVGASADLTGSGSIDVQVNSSATNTFSRATDVSFTGTVEIQSFGEYGAIIGRFGNADYLLSPQGTASRSFVFLAGTLYCKDYKLTYGSSEGQTVTNSTNNPSFEISGDTDIQDGSFTTTYTKGTGTIKHTGSSGTQTIDWAGKSIENVTFDCSGATKELAADFTTATCTFSNGTVQSTVAGTQRTITATNTSVAANTTFKDISMGSANRVNAKAATNTNNGNCKGIVFTDYVE